MTMPALRPHLLPCLLALAALGLGGCGSSGSTGTDGTVAGSGTSGGAAKEGAAAPAGQGRRQDGGEEGGGGEQKGRQGGSRQGSSPGNGSPDAAPSEPNFTPRPHHDSGGGAGPFETKGGDNSIQEYGAEPSGAEFEAAAAVLHEYLDARAARAWAAACERLSPAIAGELAQQLGAAQGEQPECASVLAELSAGVPAAALREAAAVDAAALRVEGNSGFLLLRDSRGDPYFIPMFRDDGGWKVAAIAASPLL